MKQAEALVDELVARSPDALAYTKRLFHTTWTRSPRWAFWTETVLQARLMTGANHKIARQAGMARQLPAVPGPQGPLSRPPTASCCGGRWPERPAARTTPLWAPSSRRGQAGLRSLTCSRITPRTTARAVLARRLHPHRDLARLLPVGGVGVGRRESVELDSARYSSSMPLGIQRRCAGMDASASAPIAISRPFATAMACTVPTWLCTPHHLRMRTDAWFGTQLQQRRGDGEEVGRLEGEGEGERPLAQRDAGRAS